MIYFQFLNLLGQIHVTNRVLSAHISDQSTRSPTGKCLSAVSLTYLSLDGSYPKNTNIFGLLWAYDLEGLLEYFDTGATHQHAQQLKHARQGDAHNT